MTILFMVAAAWLITCCFSGTFSTEARLVLSVL